MNVIPYTNMWPMAMPLFYLVGAVIIAAVLLNRFLPRKIAKFLWPFVILGIFYLWIQIL